MRHLGVLLACRYVGWPRARTGATRPNQRKSRREGPTLHIKDGQRDKRSQQRQDSSTSHCNNPRDACFLLWLGLLLMRSCIVMQTSYLWALLPSSQVSIAQARMSIDYVSAATYLSQVMLHVRTSIGRLLINLKPSKLEVGRW